MSVSGINYGNRPISRQKNVQPGSATVKRRGEPLNMGSVAPPDSSGIQHTSQRLDIKA